MGQAFHTNGQHRGRRESARRFEGIRVSALPRGVLMGAKRLTTVFCVFVLSTTGVWAADRLDSSNASNSTALATTSSTSLPSPSEVVTVEPWIHGGMDEGLRDSIEVAFEIAAQRVQEVESCSDLFREFGIEATEVLDRAVYMPIFSRHKVKKVCGRNLAYTFVGAPSTFICPKFERVSDQHAAMVIIHEALHTAGLEEAPTNPGAKTSQQINSMVAKSCHF